MRGRRLPELRRVGTATAGTAVGNVLSLALPFLITRWFDDGATTDAYFYALGAVLFLNVAVSMAVESATTPYVTQMHAADGDAVKRFVRRTQLQAAAVCAVVCLIGVAAVALLLLPATSFDDAQQDAARQTLVLLLPLPVVITWNAVLAGASYAYRAFGVPTASVGLRTLSAMVFGLSLHQELGVASLPIGLVVGELLRTALLEAYVRPQFRGLPPAVKTAVLPPPSDVQGKIPTNTSASAGFWSSAAPPAVSMSLGGLSPIVDKTVAIGAGVGAVTTIELAHRLVYTPVLLLLAGVGLVLGSRWASHVASNAWPSLKLEYRNARQIVFRIGLTVVATTVPAAFALRPVAQEVLSVPDATALAWTFSAAAIGIPFSLVGQLSVRVLLAARTTRLMPYMTVATIVLNLILDLALLHVLGVAGIALASALVNVVNAAAYGLVVRRLMRNWTHQEREGAHEELSEAPSSETRVVGVITSREEGRANE